MCAFKMTYFSTTKGKLVENVQYAEMSWDEMRWAEMRWAEMKWAEMSRDELVSDVASFLCFDLWTSRIKLRSLRFRSSFIWFIIAFFSFCPRSSTWWCLIRVLFPQMKKGPKPNRKFVWQQAANLSVTLITSSRDRALVLRTDWKRAVEGE